MSDKYSVNYEDERFKAVENEKTQKVTETQNMYDNMLANNDKYYQDQINASKEWANKQQELQQQQTDLTVEKINQQKEQAQKDYTKEQKGAYSDWQKESNRYGVNAENLASSGLSNSGYAQSLQVDMWNTYQNRKASARESLNNAILNYDNGIKEAELANNSALAEIAYNSLQNELELALQGFQAKNQLLLQKEAQLQSINDNYYNRYQNVLAQINAEIERQRQHDMWYEEFKENQKQREQENAIRREEFALKQQQYAIENDRAERQLQSALATEAAQRAAINSEISNMGTYTINQSNASTNNTTGLRSVLAGISGVINTLKSTSSTQKSKTSDITIMVENLRKLKNKDTMRQVLAASYQAGNLSDSDVEKIGNILGL